MTPQLAETLKYHATVLRAAVDGRALIAAWLNPEYLLEVAKDIERAVGKPKRAASSTSQQPARSGL